MGEMTLFEPQEQTVTTRELAEQLKTSPKVILENAKKCLPKKIIENGKATYWTQAEITVLIEQMKTSNPNQNTFTGAVKAVSTELTPALKIRNAMLMMQEAYEEELKNINAKYLAEKAVTDRITNGKGCFSMSQTAKALKLPYGRIKLFERLRSEKILNLDNSPSQEQINAGHFKVVVKHVSDEVGNKSVTLTTGKGLVYLAKRLNTEIDENVQADA